MLSLLLSDTFFCLYYSLLRLLSRHCPLHLNSLSPFQHIVLWGWVDWRAPNRCVTALWQTILMRIIRLNGGEVRQQREMKMGKYVKLFYWWFEITVDWANILYLAVHAYMSKQWNNVTGYEETSVIDTADLYKNMYSFNRTGCILREPIWHDWVVRYDCHYQELN